MPVVDQTGLQGAYTFSLAWTPAAHTASVDPPDPAAGSTLFEALKDHLGLKLENKKLPLPVIVIDRVERVLVEN